jgi:hypothetical protein
MCIQNFILNIIPKLFKRQISRTKYAILYRIIFKKENLKINLIYFYHLNLISNLVYLNKFAFETIFYVFKKIFNKSNVIFFASIHVSKTLLQDYIYYLKFYDKYFK